MNNPLFYYDIDGKDVGVTITRNPQGGGSITFYSTIYVTGVDAANKVKLYQDAFDKFIKGNGGMKTSDGKWDVKIKMEFKVATEDDVKRITKNKQEMAAENIMNVAAGDGRPHSGIGVPGSSDKGLGKDLDKNGFVIGEYSPSGRYAQMYSARDANTSVHEELHNWGFGDYYADVVYSWKTEYTDGRKPTQGKEQVRSVPFLGYEVDIMSMGLGMAPTHIDDLANTALKTSEIKGSDNFVMGRRVDLGRPHGNWRAGQVQQSRVEQSKETKTTYSNPVHKRPTN